MYILKCTEEISVQFNRFLLRSTKKFKKHANPTKSLFFNFLTGSVDGEQGGTGGDEDYNGTEDYAETEDYVAEDQNESEEEPISSLLKIADTLLNIIL